MNRYSRIALLFGFSLIVLSACNQMPKQASYIPKDAVTVVGVDMKALGKKIAWNAITGSKMFQEMQQRSKEKNMPNPLNGLDSAGIDAANTIYMYMKNDARFEGGNKMAFLIPLDDAGKWEAYVKSHFPQAAIKTKGDRKEVSFDNKIDAGWNKNLLIVLGGIPGANRYNPQMMYGGGDSTTSMQQPGAGKMDEAAFSAEMDNCFNITKDNALTGNKRFAELQKSGHDVTIWANYDLLMTQSMKSLAPMMGGFSLSNVLWKDAALAGGVDFDKGSIKGDMRYYMSDDMKDIAKEFGSHNADKDMIDRLPSQNLDMMMAYHLSPKGLRAMLDKMGLLGLANMGLAQQNMTADDILDAFTGDMAIVMTDFSMHNVATTDTFMGQPTTNNSYKPALSAMIAIKINKKDKFDKLLNLAVGSGGGFVKSGNTYMVPMTTTDTLYIMEGDTYAVITNKATVGNGFMAGSFKGQKLPSKVADEVTGHPSGIYVDVQQFVKSIDPVPGQDPKDSAAIAAVKGLVEDFRSGGGEFNGEAIQSHMAVDFVNKDENSLMNILYFGMKMNDIMHQ